MSVELLDLEPAAPRTTSEQEIRRRVCSRDQKEISPKYFYDEAARSCSIEICDSRSTIRRDTELGIMRENIERDRD